MKVPSGSGPLAAELSTNHVALAVVCSVAAAFSYGLSNVLQQHEAEQVDESQTLKLGLIRQLARRPRWLVGIAADGGGFVFEALALGIGTLVLVQPILSTSLLLSLFLGGVINGRRISRAGWMSAVMLAVGVAVFLYMVKPTEGIQVADNQSWLIAAPPIIAFVLGAVALARVTSGSARGALLGLAAGTLFGTSAVLTKAFVHYLGDGPLNWIPHWEPYALAVSSISGLVLAQSAFQTGALAAVVSAEQVLQPLTGVALGVGLLDERLELSGPLGPVIVGAALIAMLGGVLALARVEHPALLVDDAGLAVPPGALPPSPRPAEG
jgi:drug/metabolite transporter (DMT)-like permease